MFCENVVRDLSIFADVFTFKSYEVLEENCHHCIECSGLRHFSLLFFHKLLAAPIVRQSFQGIILRCPLVGFAVYQLLPVLSQNSSKKSAIYWLVVVVTTMTIAVVDFAMAYSFIITRNAQLVEFLGPFKFFSRILFFAFGRNLAFNFFLYLFRERQQLRQSLEKEVQVVYRDVRKIDVTDNESNIKLLTIDDIFYCEQQRNFTTIHTVQNEKYTRLGSMKHLEQLFGEEEFVRITTTLLVPFQYIQSCKNNTV